MNNPNLRPASLGLQSDAKKRVEALRGLMSRDAQVNNMDNYTVLPINQLQTFLEHPFEVREDEELQELVESVKQIGILHPILVRPLEKGCYEIIAGHRRTAAAQKAGLAEIPCKILNVDRDTAVIIMTDTNLKQRCKLLFSEKAKAYQMQMEAFKRQGSRTDLTMLETWDTGQALAVANTESKRNIFRYIRLNYLIPELMQLTDEEKIGFRTAVELSFLKQQSQEILFSVMSDKKARKLILEDAEKLKKLDKSGEVTLAYIQELLLPEKKERITVYQSLRKATGKVDRYFKKNKFEEYEGVEIEPAELENIMIDVVKRYMEDKLAKASAGGQNDPG